MSDLSISKDLKFDKYLNAESVIVLLQSTMSNDVKFTKGLKTESSILNAKNLRMFNTFSPDKYLKADWLKEHSPQ